MRLQAVMPRNALTSLQIMSTFPLEQFSRQGDLIYKNLWRRVVDLPVLETYLLMQRFTHSNLIQGLEAVSKVNNMAQEHKYEIYEPLNN